MKAQNKWLKIRTPKYRRGKCRVCPPKNKCRNKFGCCDKRLFANQSTAEAAEFAYRNDINFSTINHYPCKFHAGWHTGHQSSLTEKEILERELLHAQTLLLDNKNYSLITKQF